MDLRDEALVPHPTATKIKRKRHQKFIGVSFLGSSKKAVKSVKLFLNRSLR